MERKRYLEMCRAVALIKSGIGGIKKVPKELHITYDDKEYYPVKYELGFAADGSTTHTAVIHELKSNAVFYVELAKVEEKEG